MFRAINVRPFVAESLQVVARHADVGSGGVESSFLAVLGTWYCRWVTRLDVASMVGGKPSDRAIPLDQLQSNVAWVSAGGQSRRRYG